MNHLLTLPLTILCCNIPEMSFWITFLTALASWAIVFVTGYWIREQVRLGRKDLKVRLQTNYEEKFEGQTLISERKKLAEQLLEQAQHEEIQESVMNFFESVGLLLRKGYLDKEMVWSGFAFYVIRWWSASKDYIFEERRIQNNDTTIFEDFQYLVDEIYKIEIKKRGLSRAELEPSQNDITRFLNAEKKL